MTRETGWYWVKLKPQGEPLSPNGWEVAYYSAEPNDPYWLRAGIQEQQRGDHDMKKIGPRLESPRRPA